jgi:hypothetical protein
MRIVAAIDAFPSLALSTLGSRNIEYLFEYSEVGGIHYQLSA